MYTSPPQGATLQPGFGSKPFSEATPIDLTTTSRFVRQKALILSPPT
jgi:hypothetical protein